MVQPGSTFFDSIEMNYGCTCFIQVDGSGNHKWRGGVKIRRSEAGLKHSTPIFFISRMIETGRYYTRSERLADFIQVFSVYILIYFWSLFKIKTEIICGGCSRGRGASPWWCVCLARRHSVQPHPEGVHQTIIAITRYFTRQSFTRQVFSIMCIYRRRLTPADLPHCQRFEVISP